MHRMIYLNHFRFMACFLPFTNTFPFLLLVLVMVLCYFKLGMLLYTLNFTVNRNLVCWKGFTDITCAVTVFLKQILSTELTTGLCLLWIEVPHKSSSWLRWGYSFSPAEAGVGRILVDSCEKTPCRNDETNRTYIALLRIPVSCQWKKKQFKGMTEGFS